MNQSISKVSLSNVSLCIVALCAVLVVLPESLEAQSLASAVRGIEAYPEPGPEIVPLPTAPEALRAFLQGTKSLSGPRGIHVSIDPARWSALDEAECESCHGTAQRLQVGLHEPVTFTLNLSALKSAAAPQAPREISSGLLERASDGSLLWWMPISAPGAGGLRLSFDDFDLPPGASVWWVSSAGEAFGPYAGRGPLGNGAFWSNTLSGEAGILVMVTEPALPEKALGDCHFHIGQVATLRPGFGDAAREHALKQLDSCTADATCYNATSFTQIDVLRHAVAYLVYERSEGSFICTGSLLNDNDPSSVIPYMLTANHCFNTQISADSLECFWDFQTNQCNLGFTAAAPVTGVARSLGAQLLATGTGTDFTFLRLNGPLPGGRWYLGWNTTPPNAGETLYRISHPQGAQQSFSVQHAVGSPELLCEGRPNTNYLHTTHTLGATSPGSSGSPIVNAFGQLVGQLYGRCSEDNCEACDTGCVFYELDGRFSATFSSLDTWLANASGVPVNNNFQNAIQLNTAYGVTTANNRGASRESGEPAHLGFNSGASVWWEWTAPSFGMVTFSTCGSDFDTGLAVYRGSDLDGLTPVAENNDGCGEQSEVSFTAAAGTVYHIAVQGYANETGTIALAWETVAASPQAPRLTAIAPDRGAPAGGTRVELTGANLNGATEVRFGSVAATGLNVSSATALTVTTPAGQGLTNVTVTTPRGTSNGLTYNYTNAPPPPTSISINRTIAYGNCWQRSGTVQVPGASRIRLILDALDIEFCCDELRVAGTPVTAAEEEFTSAFSGSNTIGLSLTSDTANTGSFRIAAIEYEGTSTGDPIFTGDLFDGPAGDDCIVDEGPCGNQKSIIHLQSTVRMAFADAATGHVALQRETGVAGVPPLSNARAGKVWRFAPESRFDVATGVLIPLPAGVKADHALVLFHVDDPVAGGWYRGDHIEGWLTAPPVNATNEQGIPCLALQVTHGGRIQIVEDTYPASAKAAGMVPATATEDTRTNGLILLLAALALLTAARMRRKGIAL